MRVGLDLSPRAVAILAEKAVRYGWSESRVAEWMIGDFGPSDATEIAEAAGEARRMRQVFLDGHPAATLAQAWRSGYAAGWKMFQMRHRNHPFRFASPQDRERLR